MSDKPELVQQPDRLSLKRWSRRKLEAARAQAAPAREPGNPPEAPVAPEARNHRPRRSRRTRSRALPPIESLTIDSEFAAFFKPDVPEATKRAALKQLFRDPRFNIMDGLDVYIGDYTQSDPIPPEMMKRLLHTRHIFNPPKTEVNAEGHVVDVVEARRAGRTRRGGRGRRDCNLRRHRRRSIGTSAGRNQRSAGAGQRPPKRSVRRHEIMSAANKTLSCAPATARCPWTRGAREHSSSAAR